MIYPLNTTNIEGLPPLRTHRAPTFVDPHPLALSPGSLYV